MVHETYDLPAIILSTHHMDKAAALAPRIIIMIEGELLTTLFSLSSPRIVFCGDRIAASSSKQV
jgi:ABC-type proline/glycine betaine transport system ATPase subunit